MLEVDNDTLLALIFYFLLLYFSIFFKSVIDIYNQEFCKLIGTFWYFQDLIKVRPILYNWFVKIVGFL